MIGIFSSTRIKLPAAVRSKIKDLAEDFARWRAVETMVAAQLDVSGEIHRRTAAFMDAPSAESLEAVLSISAISARSARAGDLLQRVRARLKAISDEAARLAVEPVEAALAEATAAVAVCEAELRAEDSTWHLKGFTTPKDLEKLRESKRVLEGLLSDLKNGVAAGVDPQLLLQ